MKSQHRKLPTHVHSYVQLEQQPHPLGSGLPTAPPVHRPLPGLDWGPRAGAAGQGALWHLGHRLLLQALQGQCASHPKNTKLNLLNLFLRPAPLGPPAPWEKLLPLGESGHPLLPPCESVFAADLPHEGRTHRGFFTKDVKLRWGSLILCACVRVRVLWQLDLSCGCWVDSTVNVGRERLCCLPDLMVIACGGSLPQRRVDRLWCISGISRTPYFVLDHLCLPIP